MNLIYYYFCILFLSFGELLTLELSYYEIIKTTSFNHHLQKRSINSLDSFSNKLSKELSFSAYNQNFKLLLNENHKILHPDFKVFSLDKFGNQKQVFINRHEYFKGNIIGKNKSDVTAHIEDDTGLMTASIYDNDNKEAYFIEPASNLFDKYKKNNQTMIIYRQKDLILNSNVDEIKFQNQSSKSFCGYIKIDDKPSLNRIKKQINFESFWQDTYVEPTKCSLRLVADYTFYKNMGDLDLRKTISFLINLILRVDEIFKRTNWTYSDTDSENFHDYGFIVQEILVHENYFMSNEYNPYQHYNLENDKRNVRDLLEAFSRTSSHRSFCLAHLFTHRTFDNGILGLAYVSSPRQYSYGGICSQPYYKDSSYLYLNTGLTTTKNSFGKRVLTRQAILITAHELGHNWGAEHDPYIPECSPKSSKGGSFIMNTFSVNSFDKNNEFFSICSRRSIKSVLKVKARNCFSKPKPTFCGNGIVEKGEDCDPGITSGNDGDDCCTGHCKLKPTAVCSDKNSPCCFKCNYAKTNVLCRDSNEFVCLNEAYCSGNNAECPQSDPLPDETNCYEGGVCRNGKCLPFCEKNNLISCMCEDVKNSCKLCCKESINSTCLPYLDDSYLKDGTICLRGYCAKGKCLNVSQDYIERFWSFVDDIKINNFTIFIKDNLVGCVIFLSLIIFVPVCYYIDKIDKELNKSHKLSIQISNHSDDNLYKRPNCSSRYVCDSRQPRLNRTRFPKTIPQGRILQVLEDSPFQLYEKQNVLEI